VQTIAHTEPICIPLQCLPLGSVAHEEYLDARIFEESSSLNQGAYALLGSQSPDEQDTRPLDAGERILERTVEE
jgi:hypothetical protein